MGDVVQLRTAQPQDATEFDRGPTQLAITTTLRHTPADLHGPTCVCFVQEALDRIAVAIGFEAAADVARICAAELDRMGNGG